MTKFASIPYTTTPALTDTAIGVGTPGTIPSDQQSTWANVLKLLAATGGTSLSSQLQTYTPSLSSTSGGTWSSPQGWYINLGGIKLCWGNVQFSATSTSGHCAASLPSTFFASVQLGMPFISAEGGNAFQTASGDTFTTTNAQFYVSNTSNGSSAVVGWLAIGA